MSILNINKWRIVFEIFFTLLFIAPDSLIAQGYNSELCVLLPLINKLENGENIIYTKYGDGEYYCMAGLEGSNCDGDTYHSWLGNELKKALIELAIKPNTYIGQWWGAGVYNYCNQLALTNNVQIPWIHYHTIMNCDEFLTVDYMYKLVKFIVHTPRKKILICSKPNSRLKDFFRTDVYIEIPEQNWSFEYSKYRDLVISNLEKNCIVLICGGLCSKVLINEITNNNEITCLDLGSSFDILGKRQNNRGRGHTYFDELRYYKEFIPQNWDQEKND